MFIGYFTERPYQDPQSGYFGATGKPIMDLTVSNEMYNSALGAELYNRYLDEKIYAEEMGFDGLMLNEHHGTPFCMGGAMNVEASILARMTRRAKIVLLGNILPIWDDPLWLVEQLAMIDLISHGRLVSGWVRGTGRESVAHNIPPHYNWERFQEAHEFVVKAWTTSGPFRWEGKHFHFRHVNPWVRPYQKPHPPIWLPGVVSRDSLMWAAQKRIPYIMLATEMEPTRQAFQLYHDTATELGYESGPQNIGYLWKVHVDETEELAEQTGRKYVQGPSNPFLAGNEGTVNPALLGLPGLTSRTRVLPTQAVATGARGGAASVLGRPYERQIQDYTIISGTPKTVIPKIRHVLEYIRPGSIFFWDGDGAMTHDDAMRSLRLMGAEVIPAIREMAKELELPGPFEVDPATGKPLETPPAAVSPRSTGMAPAPSADLTADVVVIGGGPGGSTTATMLARQGWQVLLLERERFPRDHIGESLLPASIPVLEELGVLPAVQAAGFLRKWGATMLWGTDQEPWSWYFRETNQQYPHSYQVWRPLFDQLLLDNSRAHGVEVRESHQVVDVLFADGRACGVRYTADGAAGIARARFVVDASGQGALLGRKLQLRRWDAFFQNLAVYGYFTGVQRLPAPDDTNIFIESYPHGWFWHIPLHTGWTSTGAVVDSRTGQEAMRRTGPLRFLMDQVAQAPHTTQMLRNARLVYGPFVMRDWSYISDEVVGDGYILVGDAACFVDPLFSSGVHLALMAGVLAAAYVTTVLKDPSMQEAAGRVYKEMYYKEYDHFRAMAQLFYSSNRSVESYFWEARRLLGAEAHLSPRHAFIRAVAGQPPRGYERVVLEHGQAPTQFVDSVNAVEAERVARRARLTAVVRANADITRTSLYRAVPRLATDVEVQRKPVIASGEFVWGDVLITAGYPEGTPCSPLVAQLVSLVDGHSSVAGLLTRLCEGRDETQRAQIATSALMAIQILYIDGTIADLSGC